MTATASKESGIYICVYEASTYQCNIYTPIYKPPFDVACYTLHPGLKVLATIYDRKARNKATKMGYHTEFLAYKCGILNNPVEGFYLGFSSSVLGHTADLSQ